VSVLVATDVAARGLDIEKLPPVVNFDLPLVAQDYIHRVGRTARAELTGDAYTFVSPEEEGDLAAIERAIGKRLPRETFPGFDYRQRPAVAFEIPIGERIAQIRARKADERARHAEKVARKEGRPAPAPRSSSPRSSTPRDAYPRGRSERPPAPRRDVPESGPGWSFTPAPRRDDGGRRGSGRPRRRD